MDFWENWGAYAALMAAMMDVGIDASMIPSNRRRYLRIKLKLLIALPEMQSAFDFLEAHGKSAAGTGDISRKQFFLIGTEL